MSKGLSLAQQGGAFLVQDSAGNSVARAMQDKDGFVIWFPFDDNTASADSLGDVIRVCEEYYGVDATMPHPPSRPQDGFRHYA